MTASLKGKLIAGFLLAFLAGGVTGAFLTFHQSRHRRADFEHRSHSLTERMRDRIKTQLDLTPDQLTKISPILDQATSELQDIRAETGAKVRRVMDETNRALQPVLTEPQRTKLQKIQQSHREPNGFHDSARRRGPKALEQEATSPAPSPPR